VLAVTLILREAQPPAREQHRFPGREALGH
jgi:hypothetical protein